MNDLVLDRIVYSAWTLCEMRIHVRGACPLGQSKVCRQARKDKRRCRRCKSYHSAFSSVSDLPSLLAHRSFTPPHKSRSYSSQPSSTFLSSALLWGGNRTCSCLSLEATGNMSVYLAAQIGTMSWSHFIFFLFMETLQHRVERCYTTMYLLHMSGYFAM